MDASPVSSGITANHDVLLDESVVRSFARLEPVLGDPEQRRRFVELDTAAKTAKRRYVRVGVASIACAFVALEYQAFSIAYEAHGHHPARVLNLAFGLVGLMSVVLVAGSYITGLRHRWLENAFARERLRLWRHQLLLDGALLDQLATNPDQARQAVARRWATFALETRVSDGAVRAFIEGRPPAPPVMAIPADLSMADDVLQLQEALRLKFQLRFAAVKDSDGAGRLSPRDQVTLTDWMATTTLVVAVVLSAAGFAFEAVSDHAGGLLTDLNAVGLGLVVASAAVRALRSGLTVPQERDSYAEYARRLHALDEAFDTARDRTEKWRILREVEVLAAEELHRFLTMKWDSRFIL